MTNGRMAGRIALITGGSSGIGKAIASLLASRFGLLALILVGERKYARQSHYVSDMIHKFNNYCADFNFAASSISLMAS